MQLNTVLYDLFRKKAETVTVETLCMGLRYTVVCTSDGGIGIAFTDLGGQHSCLPAKVYQDPEGLPAIQLLEKIHSNVSMERTSALALVNALNHGKALALPEERDNNILFDKLAVGKGTKVAMVGLFRPLMAPLEDRQAVVEVIDTGKNVGQKEDFYSRLGSWADVLILTATTIINNTTEEILGHTGKHVKTVILGPSTPMNKETFAHLPVHHLAGMVPVEKEPMLKAVRHGMGTPVTRKFGRKVYMDLTPNLDKQSAK